MFNLLKKVNFLILKLLYWKSRHRLFAWSAYARWVTDVKLNKDYFVPYTDKPYYRKEDDPKIFAYYLPQFYPIPENDIAYGKGFTEWQNVVTCIPHYVGHYQPKIPYELGLYNLLLPGVMERQVEIARTYGIYGFCFYFYWFSGKKVLEKPLEYWLSHREIDFHYHFCWANGDWIKRLDGFNDEIVLKQEEIKEEDGERFFYDILPYIKDDRYEKINNRPILMIYRPALFDNDLFLKFVNTLNNLACENGFDGFYLTTSNYDIIEPSEWGLDGVTEFPPHQLFQYCRIEYGRDRLVPETKFTIYDTHKFIEKGEYISDTKYPLYKTCFPSWDSTPRRAWKGGSSFIVSDNDFESWLKGIIRWTRRHHPSNEQYVYINAWNEWGEGAILEPSLRYGYKYLQLVKNSIEELRGECE